MLATGVIHFIIIPHHWEHAPAHGLAMGIIGALEAAWAAAYWLRPSRKLAQAGFVLAVGLIALWAITRVAPAPFTNEAEEVDFSGVLTKVLEGISALALLGAMLQTAPSSGRGAALRTSAATLIILSVILAAGVYEAARAAQPLFPQLSPPPGMEHMDEGGEHMDGAGEH